MANTSTTSVGRRQADWADFYKNGLPNEVIVIDDDTPPPPPSLSSSSTSSSTSIQHMEGPSHLMASSRYRVVQQSQPQYYHAGNSSSQMGPSSRPIVISEQSGRGTKRSNKRAASTELAPLDMNGSSSHASNQHYAYPRQYAPIHLDDDHPAPIYSDSTVRPDIGSSPTGTSAQGKKKRRPNTETKYVQPRVPPENQAPYQPPTPKSHGNATMANRNVCGSRKKVLELT